MKLKIIFLSLLGFFYTVVVETPLGGALLVIWLLLLLVSTQNISSVIQIRFDVICCPKPVFGCYCEC